MKSYSAVDIKVDLFTDESSSFDTLLKIDPVGVLMIMFIRHFTEGKSLSSVF